MAIGHQIPLMNFPPPAIEAAHSPGATFRCGIFWQIMRYLIRSKRKIMRPDDAIVIFFEMCGNCMKLCGNCAADVSVFCVSEIEKYKEIVKCRYYRKRCIIKYSDFLQ